MYFYVVARDLQEVFGRILCIFNDTVGLYHIQQARFYQTLYAYSAASKNPSTQQRTNPTLENLRRQFEAQQIETQRQLAEIQKRSHDQLKGSLKEQLESLSERLEVYHKRDMDLIPEEKREEYRALCDPTRSIKNGY